MRQRGQARAGDEVSSAVVAVLEAVLQGALASGSRLGLEHSIALTQAALAAAASHHTASSSWQTAATLILNSLQVGWLCCIYHVFTRDKTLPVRSS